MARSRFTRVPWVTPCRLDRRSVSGIISTLKFAPLMSTAVRHTPLTAIESPCWASEAAFGPLITNRTTSACSRTSRTSPTSSTIPVNIALAHPSPVCGDPAGLGAQRRHRPRRVIRAVDRRPGHKTVHTRLRGRLDGVAVDPAVDLHQDGELPGVHQMARGTHLVQHLGDEPLPTEPGFNAHHQ